MFWSVLLLSIVLMALVFVFLGIQILFKKNGRFPNSHIGGNKEMAKRGIQCATTQDRMARKKPVKIKFLDIKPDEDAATTSC